MSRFGQLSYTSFDASGTTGGWQVKEVTGGIGEDEAQLLVSGVRTVLDPVDGLPDYPDANQIESLPRRLAYHRLDEQRAGYWHTVPAGVDATGRPGNIFAHVILDRMPASGPPERPIQRWHSPGWLRPFGPDAVIRAELPAEVPPPGTVVTRDGVIAFALDTSTFRLGTLFGLLDAVAAALDGGPAVVLGAESVDSAAQWIGLISFLMSAGTAARLNFSTFDRGDQVHLAVHSGQHLTAVPLADLPSLQADVVVIDETATLSLGEYGGDPHVTEAGQSITVTPWSAMAQVAFLDAHTAGLLLADIDSYAAQVGDANLHPAWPVAMSMIRRDEFADARDEANDVLAIRSPAGLNRETDAGRALTDALALMVGTSTADAWQAAKAAPRGGDAAAHANRTYLLRALADDAWLYQDGPVPVAPLPTGHAADAELTAAVGQSLGRAYTAGPEHTLRLVDYLARIGLGNGELPAEAIPSVATALGDANSGPALADRLSSRIGPATTMSAAAATLRTAKHREGSSTVPVEVLSWFADGLTVPSLAELKVAQPWDATWMRVALRGARAELAGPQDPTDSFAQLWWLKFCGAQQRFPQLASSQVWDPAQLLAAVGGSGAGLGMFAVPTLLGTPSSPELRELATAVLSQSPDRIAKACAATRVFDPAAWVQQGNVERQQASHVALWDQGVELTGASRVHADVATWLLAVAAVASISNLPAPLCLSTLSTEPVVRSAGARVAALVEAKLVKPAPVLGLALFRTTKAEDDTATDAGQLRRHAPVDDVLLAAAETVAAAQDFTDEDEEAIAMLMARWAGAEADPGALKRNRKTVHKFIASHKDSQPSLAARMLGKS